MVENGDGDLGKNTAGEGPAKRTRRVKAVEESEAPAPAQPPAKAASRQRRNVQDTKAVAEAQVTKEDEEGQNKAKVAVAGKKPQGRAKKMETEDSPTVTFKGRSKKNLAKETANSPPEEAEIKKQNDNKTKKENAKKAAPRVNTMVGKANEAQAEEKTAPELDIKENGETQMAEPKQKKRNVGKANAASNGTVETKGKQKKGQVAAASIDEEATKDVIAETSGMKSEIDEKDTKDITSQSEEETIKIADESADSIKREERGKVI